MAIVLLVRHGRTTANSQGILAGRLASVLLDETGLGQAEQTAERLAVVPLTRIMTSPLERCRQTAQAIAEHHERRCAPVVDHALTECGYGAWQGRSLTELAREPLWQTVQTQPSAVVFPDGEAMLAMQSRAVAAVRRTDAEIESQHGAGAVWAAVSHGDVIKAILADALGTHLDLFQRLHADPASVSIVRYGPARPEVLAMNTSAGEMSWLRTAGGPSDAALGGGAGPGAERRP